MDTSNSQCCIPPMTAAHLLALEFWHALVLPQKQLTGRTACFDAADAAAAMCSTTLLCCCSSLLCCPAVPCGWLPELLPLLHWHPVLLLLLPCCHCCCMLCQRCCCQPCRCLYCLNSLVALIAVFPNCRSVVHHLYQPHLRLPHRPAPPSYTDSDLISTC